MCHPYHTHSKSFWRFKERVFLAGPLTLLTNWWLEFMPELNVDYLAQTLEWIVWSSDQYRSGYAGSLATDYFSLIIVDPPSWLFEYDLTAGLRVYTINKISQDVNLIWGQTHGDAQLFHYFLTHSVAWEHRLWLVWSWSQTILQLQRRTTRDIRKDLSMEWTNMSHPVLDRVRHALQKRRHSRASRGRSTMYVQSRSS
jgi:hypothetical protein